MDNDKYKALLTNQGAEIFCSKAYGLELMFVLDASDRIGADNGIDDTFDLILHNKPRRAAFSKFISTLESKKHLLKVPSDYKASKTVLRMSADVAAAFEVFKES